MKKIEYPQLGEVVYEERLENGLVVTLIPKPDFAKTYGIMTTNFGSIDNHFVPLNQEKPILVPDGIAHFLEHKLFEGEKGDAFEEFSALGSSANAFTSFTRTSYLFSATSKVTENVGLLLDFVQSPYFTEAGTEKEKGIIGQEISMYEDVPDWQQFYGLLRNLYPNHPLEIDIAGTQESIQAITPELLQTCYETFYHPSNMNIVLIGNLEPESLMAFIRENQSNKTFAKLQPIQRIAVDGLKDDVLPHSELQMAVQRPKVSLGLKGTVALPEGTDADAWYLTGSLFLELLFGRGSENYLSLYDDGFIDASFGYSYSVDRGFHFVALETDTDHVEEVLAKWKFILLNWKKDRGFGEDQFALLKRAYIGEQLQAFNSLEYISNQYGYLSFQQIELFKRIERLEALTLEEVITFGESMMKEEAMTSFVITPKKGMGA